MRLLGRNRANLVKRVPIPIPTLNLDFVNGSYQFGNNKYTTPNGITGYSFGNSTGGTAFNPNTGLVQSFAPNTPRITGNGLLVEGAGSNLCLSSQKLQNGSIWTYFYLASATDGSVTAPDGTQTGSSLIATDPNSDFHSYAIPVTANQTYTLSFWVKLGAGATATKQIKIGTSAGVAIGSTVPITGANSTTWTRVSCTVNVGSNSSILLYPLTGTATAGTYYIWGVQLEQSSVPTSYIPTYYSSVTNLCQQSNYLATSPWVSISNTTATNNAAIAPDGSYTASMITTTSGLHGHRQPITVVANTTYTWSFYAKLGTMTSASYSIYNISGTTELVVATSYTSKVNSSGWSRISVTFTTPTGCTSIGCYPVRDSLSTGTIYIWGCQLETGNTATQFISVSPTVTNLCTYSQQIGSTSWTLANGSATQNSAVAPDGTTTAALWTSSATANSAPYKTAFTTTAVNQVYTNSVYLKAGTSQYVSLNANQNGNATAIFDVKNGTVTKTSTGGVFNSIYASITPALNGYFRCSISFTISTSGNPVVHQISNCSSATATIDVLGNVPCVSGSTFYMWGAQTETGYGPNQYAFTTSATVTLTAQTSATQAALSSFTRSPDVLTYGTALGLSFANTKAMIAEGSFLYYPSTNFAFAQLSDGTSSNSVLIGEYLGNFLSQVTIGGSLVKSIYQGGNINTPSLIRKQAVSFGDNRIVISQNGVAVTDPGLGNGTFGGGISINQILIGGTNTVTNPQMFGYIRTLKLYGSSLSLNQLNTLTSLQNN